MKRRQRQKKGWRRVEEEIRKKRKGSQGGGEGEGGKGEGTQEEKEEGGARERQHRLASMEAAFMIGKCINCVECT